MVSIASLQQYQDAKIIVAQVDDTLFTPEQLQAFLDNASDYLESMMYQAVRQQDFTDTFTLGGLYCSVNPQGWLNVFPRHVPINTVASLGYRLNPADTFTLFGTSPATYSVDPIMARIVVPFLVPTFGPNWTEIQVTYNAGETPSTMPGDLVEACILVAAHFASGGYAAVDDAGRGARRVVPDWAWGSGAKTKSIVDEVINRYGRQF